MVCFKGISSLSKCETLALINAVSLSLADGLNEDDLDMLGNFFAAVAGTLTTLASLKAKQETCDKPSKKV